MGRIFISYSHEGAAHFERVGQLARDLRRRGLSCVFDGDVPAGGPSEGWPRWTERQIVEADAVILICTETYARRVLKRESPGVGLGATWEAHLIYQRLYEAAATNVVFRPVVFDVSQIQHVPIALRGFDHFVLPKDLEALVSALSAGSPAGAPLDGDAGKGSVSLTRLGVPRGNLLEAEVRPNKDFAGRDDDLAAVALALREGGPNLSYAITGEGGIGKTELAKAYLFRHGGEYDGCYWIDASEAGLEQATARLFNSIFRRAPPSDSPPDQIRLAVCERLSRGRNLLVLDNLEAPNRLSAWFLGHRSRVLVTTRRTDLPSELIGGHRLDTLTIDVAIGILRRNRPDLGEEYESSLVRVAKAVGCHTLALALASAYLRFHPNVTPAELLKRISEAPVGSDDDPLSVHAGQLGTRYGMSVSASLSLHFEPLAAMDGSGILDVTAFCHHERIPVRFLGEVLHLPPTAMELSLARLAAFSILVYGKDVSLHPLTHSVLGLRVWRELDRAKKAMSSLVDVLHRTFEDVSASEPTDDQRETALHAEAVVQHFVGAWTSGRLSADAATLARMATLANQTGLHFLGRRQPIRARALLEKAASLARRAYARPDPEVATILSNLGIALQEAGHLRGAFSCYSEAERIDTALFGPDHSQTAIDWYNLGCVLTMLGDTTAARSYLSRALCTLLNDGARSSVAAAEAFVRFLEAGGDRVELLSMGLAETSLASLERRRSQGLPSA
jgi:tetratricopeptide (TPR) repeat protein